jgi:hypothetical protein
MPIRSRLLIISALVGAIALLAIVPLSAAAAEPIDLREPTRHPTMPTDPEALAELLRELTSSPPPSPAAASPAPAPPGYDVSYPQCGDAYPEASSFAIVGVNGGRVYSRNPCLGLGDDESQLAWAGPDVELYANTGNPGPDLSRYWPRGQTEPRACDTAAAPGADTVVCAYDYGWNAAAHSYAIALDAFVRLGLADADAERIPGDPVWWLDVEDVNSWRRDRSLNVAALEGAVAYLESMDAAEVGFYSTPRLWNRITGGTDAFAELPSWHAGASDEADARGRCDDEAFTGGTLRMVQWVEDGVDANVRCP